MRTSLQRSLSSRVGSISANIPLADVMETYREMVGTSLILKKNDTMSNKDSFTVEEVEALVMRDLTKNKDLPTLLKTQEDMLLPCLSEEEEEKEAAQAMADRHPEVSYEKESMNKSTDSRGDRFRPEPEAQFFPSLATAARADHDNAPVPSNYTRNNLSEKAKEDPQVPAKAGDVEEEDANVLSPLELRMKSFLSNRSREVSVSPVMHSRSRAPSSASMSSTNGARLVRRQTVKEEGEEEEGDKEEGSESDGGGKVLMQQGIPSFAHEEAFNPPRNINLKSEEVLTAPNDDDGEEFERDAVEDYDDGIYDEDVHDCEDEESEFINNSDQRDANSFPEDEIKEEECEERGHRSFAEAALEVLHSSFSLSSPSLDLSNQRITSLADASFSSSNYIHPTLLHLRVLSLRNNALRVIDCALLNSLPALEQLDVSHNCIAAIEGSLTLKRLDDVDLSHNRLQRASHLLLWTSLRSLNLSHNLISDPSGLPANLISLSLAHNRLSSYLSLRLLTLLPRLHILDLRGNPLVTLEEEKESEEERSRWRVRLTSLMPRLTGILLFSYILGFILLEIGIYNELEINGQRRRLFLEASGPTEEEDDGKKGAKRRKEGNHAPCLSPAQQLEGDKKRMNMSIISERNKENKRRQNEELWISQRKGVKGFDKSLTEEQWKVLTLRLTHVSEKKKQLSASASFVRSGNDHSQSNIATKLFSNTAASWTAAKTSGSTGKRSKASSYSSSSGQLAARQLLVEVERSLRRAASSLRLLFLEDCNVEQGSRVLSVFDPLQLDKLAIRAHTLLHSLSTSSSSSSLQRALKLTIKQIQELAKLMEQLRQHLLKISPMDLTAPISDGIDMVMLTETGKFVNESILFQYQCEYKTVKERRKSTKASAVVEVGEKDAMEHQQAPLQRLSSSKEEKELHLSTLKKGLLQRALLATSSSYFPAIDACNSSYIQTDLLVLDDVFSLPSTTPSFSMDVLLQDLHHRLAEIAIENGVSPDFDMSSEPDASGKEEEEREEHIGRDAGDYGNDNNNSMIEGGIGAAMGSDPSSQQQAAVIIKRRVDDSEGNNEPRKLSSSISTVSSLNASDEAISANEDEEDLEVEERRKDEYEISVSKIMFREEEPSTVHLTPPPPPSASLIPLSPFSVCSSRYGCDDEVLIISDKMESSVEDQEDQKEEREGDAALIMIRKDEEDEYPLHKIIGQGSSSALPSSPSVLTLKDQEEEDEGQRDSAALILIRKEDDDDEHYPLTEFGGIFSSSALISSSSSELPTIVSVPNIPALPPCPPSPTPCLPFSPISAQSTWEEEFDEKEEQEADECTRDILTHEASTHLLWLAAFTQQGGREGDETNPEGVDDTKTCADATEEKLYEPREEPIKTIIDVPTFQPHPPPPFPPSALIESSADTGGSSEADRKAKIKERLLARMQLNKG